MSLIIDATTDTLTRTTNLPPIGTFTIMAWVRLTATNALDKQLFRFGASGGTFAYYVGTSGDGISYQLFCDSSASVVSATHDFDTTNWVHVAMVVLSPSGAAAQFLAYWNGVLDISANSDSNATATVMTLGSTGAAEFWNGSVAGVKIYSVALNATEIATEAANWLPQLVTNLNGWYPMTDASVANCLLDTSAPGYTALGNNWTAGSTATTIGSNPPLAPSVTWEQEGYLWRRDDGSETTATTIGAQDTPL